MKTQQIKTSSFFFFSLFISFNVFSQTFTLKSNDLGGQATDSFFANTFGCLGKNISPELHWENAPLGTKSFAVTVYDPDAPTGSGFWHWVLFNIPPDVTSLKADAGNNSLENIPFRSEAALNDAGTYGFMGACPPEGHGKHMYIITVYAVDSRLEFDKISSAAFVGFNLHFKTLAKASLVVYGERKETRSLK